MDSMPGRLTFNTGFTRVSHTHGDIAEALPKGVIRPSESRVRDELDLFLPQSSFDMEMLDALTLEISDASNLLPANYYRALDEFSQTINDPSVREALLDKEDGDDWLIQEANNFIREEESKRDILYQGMNALHQA
tara:strand:+ start:598 stop:1002 length:405 start_codon:yes stop_codon:yes gene_type:complete